MKPQEIREVAQSLFGEHQSPFGAFSLGSETHRTVTIADAVRRGRWISVDLTAAGFSLFFIAPAGDKSPLVPCFDHLYPDAAPEMRNLGGERTLAVMRHARQSTVPCWWSSAGSSVSQAAFARLDWAMHVEPLVPGTEGIAFPVYADRGQGGLVAFLGPEIALPREGLAEIHARCFALFAAVARIRPNDSGKPPSISKRELECLRLTANGYTSDEIAKLLKLSVHTANQYLTNTAQKLDAMNRAHAVSKALRIGLIE